MVDIVERLHYAGYNDARLAEAADEIERLREGLKIASAAVESLDVEVAAQRRAANEHRNAAMEADLRTQAAVRSEKRALAEKVNASEQRRVMTKWHQQARTLGFDGVPDLIAAVEQMREKIGPLVDALDDDIGGGLGDVDAWIRDAEIVMREVMKTPNAELRGRPLADGPA